MARIVGDCKGGSLIADVKSSGRTVCGTWKAVPWLRYVTPWASTSKHFLAITCPSNRHDGENALKVRSSRPVFVAVREASTAVHCEFTVETRAFSEKRKIA